MFKISQEKLEEVTRIINNETDPRATEQVIEETICADWNEGAEHQEWIDSASAREIADWLATFYQED